MASKSHKQTVIAVNVVHRTVKPGKAGDRLHGVAPVRPKIEIIAANTRFTCKDQDEFDELMAMGAIRTLTDDEQPSGKGGGKGKGKAAEGENGDGSELV